MSSLFGWTPKKTHRGLRMVTQNLHMPSLTSGVSVSVWNIRISMHSYSQNILNWK